MTSSASEAERPLLQSASAANTPKTKKESPLHVFESDEHLEQRVSAECGVCATCVGLLIYGCALGFVVVSCLLLYEARDTRVECGDVLLIAMLTRLSLSAASLLLNCFMLWDGETMLRHYFKARPLAEDEEGGLCALAFGGGSGPWVGALTGMLFHGGCVVALAIGVSDATRRGDVCLVALSSHSFTGTYTMIAIVWTWLAGDGAAALLSLVQVLRGVRIKPQVLFFS